MIRGQSWSIEYLSSWLLWMRNGRTNLKRFTWIVVPVLVVYGFMEYKVKSYNRPAFRNFKFANFRADEWKSQKFVLPDAEDSAHYFRSTPTGSLECFIPGTDWDSTTKDKCLCKQDFYGKDCGIPDSVWFGHFKDHPEERKALVRRPKLRRLIHSVPVNHEFDFFETRIATLSDVTDVFVIQESNFTAFGTSKNLFFLQKLKQGWLPDDVNSKILYIFLSFFSRNISGWEADSFIRKHLSVEALKMIQGVRDDDLFLLLDSDEIPLPEPLLFLKIYDGFGEPVRWNFKWTVYGFYWLKKTDGFRTEEVLQLWVLCTLGMLRDVYENNAMLLRRTSDFWDEKKFVHDLAAYLRKKKGVAKIPCNVGQLGHYGGYHCSWCFSPEGIRTKLMSAQADDKPRWGDYPEKTNLTYIAKLIETGGWFDETRPFIYNGNMDSKFYAPQYMLDNFNRFKYLLEPPKQDE